jgi:hypothetical protein
MNIVYCHIDSEIGGFLTENFSFNNIPDYAFYSIKQSKFISPKSSIYMICNINRLSVENLNTLKLLNVQIIDQNELITEKIKNATIVYKQSSYDKNLANFNFVTMIRLFFVEEFMRKYNIENVLHLEYDNLLYQNIENLNHLFQDDYICCPCQDDVVCLGISFFKTIQTLSYVNDSIINLLKTNPNCYISEMFLISIISKTNKNIKFFNWSPFESEYIFDPNRYGQYICGDNHTHNPGYMEYSSSYSGKFIFENRYNLQFAKNGSEMVMLFQNKIYKFVNLHIHNKQAIKEMVTYQ